jgi:hypothetical protein
MVKSKELDQAFAQVQDYVDGTMSRRDAVRFYLLVQREPALAAEVEQFRAITAALSAEARAEPSARLNDAAILRSVPLEHYRNAPSRRLWPVIERVPFLARWLRRTRRVALAAAVAYGLVLLAGHSYLANALQSIATATRARLSEWAAASADVPVLAQVLDAAAWAFDALARLVFGLDMILGTPLLTLAFGMTFGMLCWHLAATRRRQQV